MEKAFPLRLWYPETLTRAAERRVGNDRRWSRRSCGQQPRRTADPSEEAIMQEFPPFRLDTVNQCLWRCREAAGDERILLPPKAFAVLWYLMAHAGQLVTQEELLETVWPETYVQPEVLRNHIFTIHRALGASPTQPQFLQTLLRRGYQFLAAI